MLGRGGQNGSWREKKDCYFKSKMPNLNVFNAAQTSARVSDGFSWQTKIVTGRDKSITQTV